MQTDPRVCDNHTALCQGRPAPGMSDVPCPSRHPGEVLGRGKPTSGAAPKSPALLITEPMRFSGKKDPMRAKKGTTPEHGRWGGLLQHPAPCGQPVPAALARLGGRAGSRHYPHAGGMLCSYVPFHQNNRSARVPAKPQENYSQESLSQ